VVSEAGASVYSASEYASREMPDVDVSLRGAASIARRLQDPLAELVKIDPKSIGVGQYQHDLNQSALARTLEAVVEDCVNAVGVDLNTASVPLLSRVSGLSPTVARAVVARREAQGAFANRQQLREVSGLGAKTFEQCAGFLRIRSGDNPLDNTGIHPESYAAVVNEWTEILLRDRNHPSIVGWCPFNEQDKRAKEISQMVWNVTKAIDPTRPALETSGWSHTLPNPEVLDSHDYEGSPGVLRNRWMERLSVKQQDLPAPARYGSAPAPTQSPIIPYMVSEIGGVAWANDAGWGYGEQPKKLEEFYTRYQGTIDAMLDNPHLFGFTYTQLTDVEQERNGLYFYDTRMPKFDIAKLHAITSRQAAYERDIPTIAKSAASLDQAAWKVLVGAVQDGDLSTPYAYSTEKPAENWAEASFDDRGWKTGRAPFGHGPQNVRTEWTTTDLYLRKKFEYDGTTLKRGAVVINYDEDTEVYVNGKKILSVCGYITYYQLNSVTDALKKALKKGSNTIAVHTHQAVGGQYIDLALLVEN